MARKKYHGKRGNPHSRLRGLPVGEVLGQQIVSIAGRDIETMDADEKLSIQGIISSMVSIFLAISPGTYAYAFSVLLQYMQHNAVFKSNHYLLWMTVSNLLTHMSGPFVAWLSQKDDAGEKISKETLEEKFYSTYGVVGDAKGAEVQTVEPMKFLLEITEDKRAHWAGLWLAVEIACTFDEKAPKKGKKKRKKKNRGQDDFGKRLDGVGFRTRHAMREIAAKQAKGIIKHLTPGLSVDKVKKNPWKYCSELIPLILSMVEPRLQDQILDAVDANVPVNELKVWTRDLLKSIYSKELGINLKVPKISEEQAQSAIPLGLYYGGMPIVGLVALVVVCFAIASIFPAFKIIVIWLGPEHAWMGFVGAVLCTLGALGFVIVSAPIAARKLLSLGGQ